jgi:hypothetical protein
MAQQDTDGMISISGRWWWFPGSRIGWDSEFEWRDSGVYLLEPDGTAVKGTELSEPEMEQMSREMLLADLLELAVERLRSGEGWDESTIIDVLNEVLHTYPQHLKKALAPL